MVKFGCMADHFKPLDRDTLYLLPPSMQDWLEPDHLARFVVDTVSQLDLRPIRAKYAGRGSAAYQPEMLIALWFYGYATGVYSSRKLEQATYDSVAFRYISADQHPEHDTISDFRKRFLNEMDQLFKQILLIAAASGLLKVGRVSVDGTKIKANASKHHALSYAYTRKLEEQIEAELRELSRLADEAERETDDDGMSIPAEIVRREDRLRVIRQARAEIAAREEERIACERAEYEKRLAERAEREKTTGKKSGGLPPKPPSEEIHPKAQINLTDAESRIMPRSGGGFDQAYNGQNGVDCDSRLIVSAELSQSTVDTPLLSDTIDALKALPPEVGCVEELLADAGYFSSANIEACIKNDIQAYISDAREPHYPGLQRFREPPALTANATALAIARHRLRTRAGRAIYALRKSTVEPVFGIIKAAMNFRQFLLRTLEKVRVEWRMVCMAYNLRRMHTLTKAQRTNQAALSAA
jgi:transposase